MTSLMRLMAGAALAACVTGAGMVVSGPARADSDRTDCLGNSCVHVHCFDDGACTNTNFDKRDGDPYLSGRVDFAPGMKPYKYACDEDGGNCHRTRNYYYDDDGVPIYDPGASPYAH